MMIRYELLFPVIMLALLNGCGTVYKYKTADEVTAASTTIRDDYAKYTWIRAPRVRYAPEGQERLLFFSLDEYFLRSRVTDSGARSNQLYVIYHPPGWAFLDRANDRSGQSLKVILIDRKVSSRALRSEHVAIVLDDAYLRNAAINGIDIRVAGDHGGTTVKLPPYYVEGFVVKLDEFLARR